jgi:hypothetical protein
MKQAHLNQPAAEACLVQPQQDKQYLLFSQREAEASTIRDGFWSNTDGWGDFTNATRFTAAERDAFMLPRSTNPDACWADTDDLALFFREFEQGSVLAGAGADSDYPQRGVIGFYRPDPSGPHSPNIVLGISETHVKVFEIRPGMVFTIEREE